MFDDVFSIVVIFLVLSLIAGLVVIGCIIGFATVLIGFIF